MARARRSGSQWSRPVVSVHAAGVVAPLVERAEQQVDAQAAGQRGEAPAGRAVQGLGPPDLLGGRAEVVGVLGGGDQAGTVAGGALDEAAGLEPILRGVGGG